MDKRWRDIGLLVAALFAVNLHLFSRGYKLRV